MKADYFRIKCGRPLTNTILTHDLMPVDSENEFTDLIANITRYLKSKTDASLDHQALVTCVQRENETVETYLVRLKQLIRYKDVEPSFLAKQFPHGLRDKKFKEDAITHGWDIRTIVEAANRRETYKALEAEGNKHRLTSPQEVAAVENQQRKHRKFVRPQQREGADKYRRSGSPAKPTGSGCPNCGIMNHRSGVCPAKGKNCLGCGGVGHFRAVCRKKQTDRPEHRTKRTSQLVNQVNNEDNDDWD